jgi:hypothetical protein
VQSVQLCVRNFDKRNFTEALLNIEPFGSIICGRKKLESAEQPQVLSPQMIDPSGSIFSNGTVQIIPDNIVEYFPNSWTNLLLKTSKACF